MEELKRTFQVFFEGWTTTFTFLNENIAQWNSYFSNTSTAQVDEIVRSLNQLLQSGSEPNGFAPTYHIAKSYALNSINEATKFCDEIKAGTFQSIPLFNNSLVQMISGFHTMLLFSDIGNTEKLSANLSLRLSESIALINTAQTELKEKIDLLVETKNEIKDAIDLAFDLSVKKVKSDEDIIKISENQTIANEKIESIKKLETSFDEVYKNLKAAVVTNNDLNTHLETQLKNTKTLQDDSEKQLKLITDLLPGATSAALAHAFADRAKRLNKTKITWSSFFIFSIAGLVAAAFIILSSYTTGDPEFWKYVLQRLPFTIPFVWLGWFSAIQYGNTIRVQEDYEFKAATSMAFAGYKDYMEHMANVNLQDANTAMKLLAERTIEILAHEPMRFYQKAEHDATPARSFLSSFMGNNKTKSETSGE